MTIKRLSSRNGARFQPGLTKLGRLDDGAGLFALQALVLRYLRRADRIVAIGETMRARLVAKGARADRIAVIPNWVDTRALAPAARDNAWAREHGLDRRFVVMHSGNIGHVLAVARPVIVAADAESETSQIVERAACGVVVPPGQPDLLADAIRRARDGELDLAEMGRRGRDYVTADSDRRIAVDRYRTLLAELR